LLAFLFLTLPKIVFAGAIQDLAAWIATWPLYFLVQLAVKVAIFFTRFCGIFLTWVLSPGFISYSYTRPGDAAPDNPVIQTGLEVTAGFANMILVLVLVYIAIAIMLQLAGRDTKKLLVTFLIVALLVNFSTIICGVIVDTANIIMNFFTRDLSADAFSENLGSRVAALNFEFNADVDTTARLQIIAQLAILVPFILILGFIMIILAFIFIFRYIAIWILVILSPIAFVLYIAPATRRYFQEWWSQFIGWSFIGATCGFFLYLALYLVMRLETNTTDVVSPVTIQNAEGAFNAILPFFVAVAFLALGLVFGLKTSAMGANSVIRLAKSTQKKQVQGAEKATKWVGKKAAKGAGSYAEEKSRIKERIAPTVSKIEKTPVIRWFMPEGLKKYAEHSPSIQKGQNEAKDYSSGTNMDDVMSGKVVGSRAAGRVLETIDRGDAEDIFKAGRRKFGANLTDEQLLQHDKFRQIMGRNLTLAKMAGKHSKILRSDPRLAALTIDKNDPNRIQKEKEAVKEAARESRGSHIQKMEPETIHKDHGGLPVTEAFMERGRDPFENIARSVKRGIPTVQDSIDKLFSNYIDNVLSKTNSSLANKARSGNAGATKKAWGEYHKHFKAQNNEEGYFVALGSQRFRDLGYREGKYVAPSTPRPSSPSPGSASMGSAPPNPSPKPRGRGNNPPRQPKGRGNKKGNTKRS